MNNERLSMQAQTTTFGSFIGISCPVGGSFPLCGATKYPFLFVLEGAVHLLSGYSAVDVTAGNLIALDASLLVDCSAEPGSVVVEFVTRPRMAGLIRKMADVFGEPFSQAVPILPQLKEWLDRQLGHSYSWDLLQEGSRRQCREFSEIMASYPQSSIQDLYAVFFACRAGLCSMCCSGDVVPETAEITLPLTR